MNRPGHLLHASLALLALWLAVTAGRALADPGVETVWLLVDTRNMVLSVMRGDAVVMTYDNIAIGSGGAGWDKRLGDQKTPLGDFRINEIRPSARFDLFLALDYPTLADADRAYREGRLDAREVARIQSAKFSGRPPPQDTPLGGHLGIHGLGAGDPLIHASINWTDGCIALTNEQVEDLAARVTTGTPVKIR